MRDPSTIMRESVRSTFLKSTANVIKLNSRDGSMRCAVGFWLAFYWICVVSLQSWRIWTIIWKSKYCHCSSFGWSSSMFLDSSLFILDSDGAEECRPVSFIDSCINVYQSFLCDALLGSGGLYGFWRRLEELGRPWPNIELTTRTRYSSYSSQILAAFNYYWPKYCWYYPMRF